MKTRRQVLGQNFLHHQPTIQKIADAVRSALSSTAIPPKSILEIGPGELALTNPLRELAKEKNLPLFIVERDQHLEAGVREGAPEAELHMMDAAAEKFQALLNDLAARGLAPVFIASNLPYSAASQILANLCREQKLISGAVVMVQKEMAKRMAATEEDGELGSFSWLIQNKFHVKQLFDVQPGAFNPPPKVVSTVLKLDPVKQPLISDAEESLQFETFGKHVFSRRRKMIRGIFEDGVKARFEELGLKGTERPENLSLETAVKLFKFSRELRE